mgnify:CR=1 FL=1
MEDGELPERMIALLSFSRAIDRISHVAAIVAAIDRYAVVVFHDQKLTDDQQIDFARQIAEAERSKLIV